MKCPCCSCDIPDSVIRSHINSLAGSRTSPAKRRAAKANAQRRWELENRKKVLQNFNSVANATAGTGSVVKPIE